MFVVFVFVSVFWISLIIIEHINASRLLFVLQIVIMRYAGVLFSRYGSVQCLGADSVNLQVYFESWSVFFDWCYSEDRWIMMSGMRNAIFKLWSERKAKIVDDNQTWNQLNKLKVLNIDVIFLLLHRLSRLQGGVLVRNNQAHLLVMVSCFGWDFQWGEPVLINYWEVLLKFCC